MIALRWFYNSRPYWLCAAVIFYACSLGFATSAGGAAYYGKWFVLAVAGSAAVTSLLLGVWAHKNAGGEAPYREGGGGPDHGCEASTAGAVWTSPPASTEVDCYGPDWCIDDLCASSERGICGRWSAHAFGEDCGRPGCIDCEYEHRGEEEYQ